MTEEKYTAGLEHVARFASERFDVFISYSSADTSVAMTMSRLLGDNGISHWYAPEYLRDKGGVSYQREIARGIDSCTVLLLLYSASAARSSWVEEEVALAREKHKVIIAFRLDEAPFHGIYDFLRHRQHFVISFEHPLEEIRKVTDSIRNAIYREEPLRLPPEEELRSMLKRMVEPVRPYKGLRERYYYDVRFRRRVRSWLRTLVQLSLISPALWIVGVRLFTTHYTDIRYFGGRRYYGYRNLVGYNHGYGVDSSATQIYKGDWFLDQHHGTGYLASIANGDTVRSYRGGFFLNKFYGKGILANRTNRYAGDFFWGLFDGYGEETRYPSTDSLVGLHFGFSSYKGRWKNGERHGYGEWMRCADTSADGLTWPRESYEGYWKNGEKHGYGKHMRYEFTYFRSDSACHCVCIRSEGRWRKGQFDGKGTRTWTYFLPDSLKDHYRFHPPGHQPLSYTGQWKEGLRHGKGVEIMADSTRYEGLFADGYFEEGIIYTSNRLKIEQFRHNPRLAKRKVKVYYPNGDRYTGYWVDSGIPSNGEPDSLGEMRYADGLIFKGNWHFGRPRSGIRHWPNETWRVYTETKEKYIGVGTILFSDGSSFEGVWDRNGWRKGFGTYIDVNGAKWEGRWEQDSMNQGKVTTSNGTTFEGEWNDTAGEGTIRYADGRRYEGAWHDFKRHGRGRMLDARGRILREGVWADDRYLGAEDSEGI